VSAVPPLNPDEKVLAALEPHDPWFQINEEGRVVNLFMTWRDLPTPVMAEIDKLTELRYADLAFSTVTDEGLAQLKDLQNLKSLGLGNTLVTDQGLVHLEKLKGLEQVWLTKQRVTQQGVEKLKTACPNLDVHWR
jgi:hypothetical protein